MQEIYKKGFSPVIIIIIILIAVATGGYFFFSNSNGNETRDESSKLNEPQQNQPVGFEENPSNLPFNGNQAPSNPPATQASANANIDIANFAFSPATITIKVGQRVAWANKDSSPHTVTSDTGLFDSGNLPVDIGNSYSKIFSQVGTFKYHCSYHPNMKGTIIVIQ